MAASTEDCQPTKSVKCTEFTFHAAARREKLNQEDLDRFPGSLLHTAAESADSEVPIPLPNDGPQGPLVPMIFELYRGANLGEMLLAAFCTNPAALANGKLCLEDIEQSLDYFKLLPSFLRKNLADLISEVAALCGGDKERPNCSDGDEEGFLEVVLSFSPALPALYRLITAANARSIAYNVLHALKRKCPMWSLACGSAFFIVLAPRSGSLHPLMENGPDDLASFPSCLMLSAETNKWDPDVEICQTFVAALSHARAGRLPVKAIRCVASCRDWDGKVHGTEDLVATDDAYTLASLDPALYPALCHKALPKEMQELGLEISWFQCPLKVLVEQDDDCLIMNGPLHVMSVSWGA